MKINWEEIEPAGKTVTGGIKKIKLDELPRGGKYTPKNRINWMESVGMTVYALYDEKEYAIVIDSYDKEKGNLIVNIVGYHAIDFKIHTANFPKCKLGALINNIYANPNSPNRELIISSIGEEKTKTLKPYSNTKIEIICPDCGSKQPTVVSHLTERGFKCRSCSDGFSFPEKLMRNVLLKLGIEFQSQVTWDRGKHFYDFYLPKFNAIIETHGRQHYEYSRRKGKEVRTLEEEQENDRLKRKLALDKGVKNENYHEIDCRESTLEWCKPNIEKVLKLYSSATLTDDDWREVAIKSQTNLLFEVCKQYEERRCSSVELSREFNVSSSVVQKYLKIGHSLGLCVYGGRKEQYARARIAIKGIHKETKEEIKFDSYTRAKEHGYRSESIRDCVKGKRKDYKNYTWYEVA